MREDLAKHIFRSIYRCPGCKKMFREDRIEVVHRNRNIWQFEALCSCRNTPWLFTMKFYRELVERYLGDLKLKEWGDPRFFSRVSSDNLLDLVDASAAEITAELTRLGIFKATGHPTAQGTT